MHYLASEHGRDSACLLNGEGRVLSIEEAIEAIGGKDAAYHEVILAGSDSECEAIRLRRPEDPHGAIREAGLNMARAYAHGRPFVLAIHEGEGRFHFHIAVAGESRGQILGRNGTLQKVWDREYFGEEGRILDWEAHKRFLALKVQVQQVIRQQHENRVRRREAIREAPPTRKAETARPFEARSRELIERRYQLELAALHERYQARGALSSARHRSEQERVEHRRTGALNRLDRRESERRIWSTGRALDRGLGVVGTQAGRALGSVGQITRIGLDSAMRELGVPRPLRATARITVSLAAESSKVALKMAMEAAMASVHASLRLAHGTSTFALAAIAAPATGGASLAKALPEVGSDLAMAGREAGRGLSRAGGIAVNSASRMASSTVREALPFEAKDAVDLAQGNVRRLVSRRLPEPLRRAMQLAKILPAGPTLAVALRMALDAAQKAQNVSRSHMEIER
jgi:hypothetical protein